MNTRLESIEQPVSIIDQVRLVILAQLETGEFSATAVAKRLGMGERTLRRKLEEHGSSFRHLLEQARLASAERMLRASSRSLTEIAISLGFSEISAFSRAFRRGAGLSPRAYRNGGLGSEAVMSSTEPVKSERATELAIIRLVRGDAERACSVVNDEKG